MKRRSRHSLKKRKEFTRRLAGYSLAAGAVLAVGGSQAEGDIVHSDDVGFTAVDFGPGYGGDYDLTMQGTHPEAQFFGRNSAGMAQYYGAQGVRQPTGPGAGANFQVATQGGSSFLKKVSGSQSIGLSPLVEPDKNSGYFDIFRFPPGSASGEWSLGSGDTGYFGFSFDLEDGGGNHTGPTVFGWAQVQTINWGNGRLLSWAYENSGDPIHVPVPSSLALLALGLSAAGAGLARKKKDA